MSNPVLDICGIVSNEDGFKNMVKSCDNQLDKPKSYPCAVAVKSHSGMGHCSDWYSFIVVENENTLYLQGVLKGWKTI